MSELSPLIAKVFTHTVFLDEENDGVDDSYTLQVVEVVHYNYIKEQNEKLKQVLQFYADKNNWTRYDGHSKWDNCLLPNDCAKLNCGGGRARLVLESVNERP